MAANTLQPEVQFQIPEQDVQVSTVAESTATDRHSHTLALQGDTNGGHNESTTSASQPNNDTGNGPPPAALNPSETREVAVKQAAVVPGSEPVVHENPPILSPHQLLPLEDEAEDSGHGTSTAGSVTGSDQATTHEVDDAEGDSAFGSDEVPSDTTSLASTILRHREKGGRTYHKFRGDDNDYWGPNDEKQNDALDVGHHMLTMLLHGKLFWAPIEPEKCRKVLDLGTGTGIWAMDFADAYPSIEVHGVDLSPSQPTWVPPNCHFAIDDIEDAWTFPKSSFDFIHMRCLMASISDWPKLYSQIYQHLAPGGWVQHLDMDIQFTSDDGTVGPGHTMYEWSRTFIELGPLTGKTFDVPRNAARWMREAGLERVEERWIKVPVGGWPKDKRLKQIGTWNYYYCLEGCEGWALFLLLKVLQWRMEEIQVFIAKFKNELNNRKNHAYYNIGLAWGRKPAIT